MRTTLLSALVVLFIPYVLLGCSAEPKVERDLIPPPLANMEKILSHDMEKIDVLLLPLIEVGPSVNSTMYRYGDEANNVYVVHIYTFDDIPEVREKLESAMSHILTEVGNSGAKPTIHQLLMDTSAMGPFKAQAFGMDLERPFIKFAFGKAKDHPALIQIFSPTLEGSVKAYRRLLDLRRI